MSLDLRRRFYAEELDALCGFRTPGLVEAFAAVPRERYLPPGPWNVFSMADLIPGVPASPRVTPDADPVRVSHNIGIAIDPARQLFNGHPATLANWIDALELKPGARVLHVGCGLGYYTAIMAHVAGPAGAVAAIEVDAELATKAARNLASIPWVSVAHGDSTSPLRGPLDAILVNAGVTHPRTDWLDALAIGGRLMLPLTVSLPAMGPTIGKGSMLLITRESEEHLSVRPSGFLAIYSAVGLRDATLERALGQAMAKTPVPPVKRVRRDAHEAVESCWLHVPGACLSTS
jgi:protein-L-isoaspartate(D-aspartate) O-methyltransferase